MKNQIEQPALQTVSRADVFTQLPDGSTVEGIKGAFVHFDSKDYEPNRTDVSAKKFLRQIISIREAVKQLDIPDISKPEIRLALPEARIGQPNLT